MHAGICPREAVTKISIKHETESRWKGIKCLKSLNTHLLIGSFACYITILVIFSTQSPSWGAVEQGHIHRNTASKSDYMLKTQVVPVQYEHVWNDVQLGKMYKMYWACMAVDYLWPGYTSAKESGGWRKEEAPLFLALFPAAFITRMWSF